MRHMGPMGLGHGILGQRRTGSGGFALLRSETGLGTGTRGTRTQAVSPLKRLNMTKSQPGLSGRLALLRSETGSGTGTRGARTQAVSPL